LSVGSLKGSYPMNIFHTRQAISKAIQSVKSVGKSVGFVPTMGALHEGHLALVSEAFSRVDCVVVSIFVNPSQFNNLSDLENYPRMHEKDIELLNSIGNVIIFIPENGEVYPYNDSYEALDLEGLDSRLEGEFRPGHFQGVVHVVRNLFRLVKPDKAFFGLKDFQQLAVIRLMTKKLNFPIEIVAYPTKRTSEGLALSSRNLRLNEAERKEALIIYRTLLLVNELKETMSPEETKNKAIEFFNTGTLNLEYLEIVDNLTLLPIKVWKTEVTCCIAAFCGDVRLIDNMQL
jgi:pantoate--beta-alanine ligase